MKKVLLALVCAVLVLSVSAAPKKKAPKIDYVNATELTLLGKLCETTNPYHRVETANIPELTKGEARLLRMSSGLAVAFKTDATILYVKPTYGPGCSWNCYARRNGKTLFQSSVDYSLGHA